MNISPPVSHQSAAFRRVVIYDPSLVHRFGHFYVQTKSLCDTLNKKGFEHVCLVSDRAGDLVGEFDANPILNYPAWNLKHLDAYSYAGNWVNANLSSEQGLKRTQNIQLRNDDLLLMHSISPNEVMSVSNWYAGLGPVRPYLMACLHAPAEYYASETDKGLAKMLFARALSGWKPLIESGRVRLGATTPELGTYLSQQAQTVVTIVPLIVPVTGIRNHASASLPQIPTFSFTGFTPEKGLSLLVDTLNNHDFSGIVFKLQIGIPQIRDNVRNILRHRSNVEVLSGFSNSASYDQFMGTSDAVLLPYDPGEYHLRHSSIFMEAIGAGKPVLVTNDTCMARESIELGLPGLLMHGFTEQALVSGIRRLAADLPMRKSIAERVSSAYAQRLTVDAYIDRLIRWFPKDRAAAVQQK